MNNDPKSLLVEAAKVPKKIVSPFASDYAEVAIALREKGFSWGEVQEWLRAKGINFTQSCLTAAVHRYKKNRT